MTPSEFHAIRTRAGLTQSELARLLRIEDIRTIRRYEAAPETRGHRPVSGPVSLLMEMLDAGKL